jgi:hypothetical protein
MGKGYGNQRQAQRHFAKKIRQFAAFDFRRIQPGHGAVLIAVLIHTG